MAKLPLPVVIKTITQTEFYAAMGMFALAQQHMRESEKYRHALERFIGADINGSYICDAICDYPTENADFKEVLRREGIAVASASRKTKPRSKK